MIDLSKVTIGIKTFCRDGKLFHALDGIRRRLPECKIIVTDDGEMNEEKDGIYSDLIKLGHQVLIGSFDSGFGAKNNQIFSSLKTPYLLMGSDDFEFNTPEVRAGIEEMVFVLNHYDHLSVTSGRVDNQSYECGLDINEGVVTEHRIFVGWDPAGVLYSPDYIPCDLTKNYNLIRREVFDVVRWDEPLPKIGGGEHGGWYYDLKINNLKVGYVPGSNINAQEGDDSPRYNQYRRRACSPDRPCFKRRGIKKWVLASGEVDFEETR